MLAGFRSRCRMPRRWAWWIARATVAISRAAARGSAVKVGSCLSRLPPAISFMLEVVAALMLADLQDRHDVRVVEVGDRPGLVLEALEVALRGELPGPDRLDEPP